MFYLPAFGAAIAYGSDAIFGKIALNDMPLTVFIFILAAVYFVLAIGIYITHRPQLHAYFSNKKHHRAIMWALLAVILGTVIADIMMWKAIQMSQMWQLPISVTIIHTAPIFALVFVWIFFHQFMKIEAFVGLCLVIIGCGIMILNSKEVTVLT
jgi:uncharacterized membrane protein